MGRRVRQRTKPAPRSDVPFHEQYEEKHGKLPYALPDSLPVAVQPSPPASPTPGVCVTCGGGEDEGTLRTCDGCDRDYHCNAHCHWPPIAGPKQGDWLCEACEPLHPPLLQRSSPPTSPSL